MVHRLDNVNLTLEQVEVMLRGCDLTFIDDFYGTDSISSPMLTESDCAKSAYTQRISEIIVVSNVVDLPIFIEAWNRSSIQGNDFWNFSGFPDC